MYLGMYNISKMKKMLNEDLDEIALFKKAIGQGIIGGATHVKEPDSYDGMRNEKSSIWITSMFLMKKPKWE